MIEMTIDSIRVSLMNYQRVVILSCHKAGLNPKSPARYALFSNVTETAFGLV